ncbi:MAG: ABC transporter substrate-binding protein [Candidatus Aenigmarchaeota archaeon]|nr:ABC transporter substrate-binding protein [Candidatus Aenigmarchaeota archaeon]
MKKLILILGFLVAVFLLLFFLFKPQEKIEEKEKTEEILVIGTAVDLYTIDPAVGFDQAISSTVKNLYDNLYRHVDNPPRVIPWLAESHEVLDNGTTWVFKLRKDAYFHDGSPVTSYAVKYSLERLLKINKGPAYMFKGIVNESGIETPDDYTVKIKLLKPFSPFLDIIPWLFIVNPKVVEEHKGDDFGQSWLASHEAGSGPFVIKNWVPGQVYEFEIFENYWKGWPEKRLKGFTRKVIRESSERINALIKGKVHIIDWISPYDQLLLRDAHGFLIVEEPTINTFEIKMNNEYGPTSNKHVRKAISYAFDYDALEKIWVGRAKLLKGPLPPGEWVNENLEVYRLNMTKAKEELAKSPWPNGGFSLDYVYVAGLEEEKEVGLILKRQLAVLNISVNIIPMSWADAVASFRNPKNSPNLFPLYSSSAYPDPNNYLWSGYHSSTAGEWTNPGHYKNPEVDKLLEEARGTLDEEKRKQLYFKVQEIIVEDAPNIFGVSPLDFHVISRKVKGFDYCPVQGSDEEFYRVWIE